MLLGMRLYPHVLRHTRVFSDQYLRDNENDPVGLAHVMGHQNLGTTARLAGKSGQQLEEASERLTY